MRSPVDTCSGFVAARAEPQRFFGMPAGIVGCPGWVQNVVRGRGARLESLAEATFSPATSVRGLEDGLFREAHQLRRVRLPPGLVEVGPSAFAFCYALVEVIFDCPSRLEGMGEGCFYCCESLPAMQIPASVVALGKHAFSGCRALASVVFAPGSLMERIDMGAFLGCGMLERIEIPPVGWVGEFCFWDCVSLSAVVFADPEEGQALTIGRQAFAGCVRLQSLALPRRLTSLGHALGGSSVRTLSFEGSRLRELEGDCFSGGGGVVVPLEEVVLPQGIERIGLAFRGLLRLRRVTFRSGASALRSLPSEAFEECSSLERVDIPRSVRFIGHGAFRDSPHAVVFEEGSRLAPLAGDMRAGRAVAWLEAEEWDGLGGILGTLPEDPHDSCTWNVMAGPPERECRAGRCSPACRGCRGPRRPGIVS